ncbi:chloride channel CLIC-like protein 1 isoform X1 [Hydra vulgaris]|uniref:chloride channel CLIC-like protein 1 isoform X1 n=1 Tax=Hydra vulgaris TaxID=6087 RepID=UPI001F5EF347|nr:chloride channel CLIC-like protein 1 [Hydra vulgaris]
MKYGIYKIMYIIYLCWFASVFSLQNFNNEFKDDYDYATWNNPFDGGLGNLKRIENGFTSDIKKEETDNEELDQKLNVNAESPSNDASVQEKKNDSTVTPLECEAPKHYSSDIPYFKHFLSKFASFVQPGDGFGEYYIAQVRISSSRYSRLQRLLDLENNEKELLDIMIESFESFSHPNNDTFWRNTFSEQLWPVLMFIGGLCFCIIIWNSVSSWNLFLWRRNIILVVFFCFLLSIPWEWYRMYKSALSKKTATSLKDIPHECTPNKVTAWNSIRLWFKDLISTTPDQCAMYYESILVDPIWEVSPLMATSTSLSRFCGEPLKQLAATSGECFKLFFNEIPMQWQPIVFAAVFILLIILIFSLSGFEISTPFLRIGSKNTDVSKIKQIYEEKIHSLKEKNEKLMLEKIRYKGNDFKITERKYIDDIGFDDQPIRLKKRPEKIQSSISSGFEKNKVKSSKNYVSEPLLQKLTPTRIKIGNEAGALNSDSNVSYSRSRFSDALEASQACETEWCDDVRHPSVNQSPLHIISYSTNNIQDLGNSRIGENENYFSNVHRVPEIGGNDRDNHMESGYIMVNQ